MSWVLPMEITGLPLHGLVVHAAVVLGPLAALAGPFHVVVPRWRDWWRRPLVGLAAVALVSVVLTGDAGAQVAWYGTEG